MPVMLCTNGVIGVSVTTIFYDLYEVLYSDSVSVEFEVARS